MSVSNLFSIDNIPNTLESHVWADFIELLCLANIDNELSKEDLLDRVRERHDDLGEGVESFEKSDDDLTPAEKNDEWSRKSTDWFRQLKYRYGYLNSSYPFVINDNDGYIRLKRRITKNHKVYIFLLLCSSLKYFHEKNRYSLTSYFEYSAYIAFQNYIPSGKVYMFGKHKLNNHKFSGHKWDKIKKLSDELFEKTLCEKTDFEINDNGDGGLDIVGWLPFQDNSPGMALFFCQCACGSDWQRKQFDAHPDNFNYISYTVPPETFTFIPFCYRNSIGEWYLPSKIKSIVVDRIRICMLMKNQYSQIESFVDEIVNHVIEYSEDIF